MTSDGKKILEFRYYKLKTLNSKDIMKKYGLKEDITKESDVARISYSENYQTDFNKTTLQGFVKNDNGEQGGTHWTYFCVKDNQSFFDSFAGAPGSFLIE